MNSKSHINLTTAKRSKRDDFYTQLEVIEKELKNYTDQFNNKIVYLNCDDPRISNFFHYFAYNFHKLGLKKLITTCYKNQNRDLFSQQNVEKAISLEYRGEYKTNLPNIEKIGIKQLEGDGDFRSKESIELLKEADIVVTNPPFSLFREYVAQLIKYEKKFLIIGNLNAISYKEIFPYIKNNKIWLGSSIKSGDREFGVPDDYPLSAAGYRVDKQGKKFIRVKGVRWYTNLFVSYRNEEMILYKNYNKDDYPKYDNYDAIEVSLTKEIPMDYDGVMGVPITFLDKYNPKQFEILGMAASAGYNQKIVGIPFKGNKDARPLLSGINTYVRIFIRNKTL